MIVNLIVLEQTTTSCWDTCGGRATNFLRLSNYVVRQTEADFTQKAFTTKQFNENTVAGLHADDNEGISRVTSFGDYTEGDLEIVGLGRRHIRNQTLEFDGKIMHRTHPFTGTRYSTVDYSDRCLHKAYPQQVRILEQLGFSSLGREMAAKREEWDQKNQNVAC